MKKLHWSIILILIFIGSLQNAMAQCSICTKTAEQMGEGPAKALNGAIIYLMIAPFAIMGYIGYKWWKREKQVIASEEKNKA
jgi:TRAP-type C4-dicarboxylate transport system permease small subunit